MARHMKTSTLEQEQEILLQVAESSENSTTHFDATTGVGKFKVYKIFQDLRSYHFSTVQN